MRIFYEITPAFEAQDISLAPILTSGDILTLLLGQVVLTHQNPLPGSEEKKALLFLGYIKRIYPGQVHIWNDGEEPIEWSEKFLYAKKIFSSILLHIKTGKLNRLEEAEYSKVIQLKRIVNSGAISELDQGFQKNFILFTELLTDRFKKEDVFNWIRDSRILRWLKTKGIEVNEQVISYLNPPKDGSQDQVEPELLKKVTSPAITKNKKQKKKTSPKTKKQVKPKSEKKEYGHGRSDPGGKIQAAIQGLKENSVNQALIPYNPGILKLLPKRNTSIDRTIDAKEYEETTGMKLSTIKTLAREVYKS